jgi:hypothetical protein
MVVELLSIAAFTDCKPAHAVPCCGSERMGLRSWPSAASTTKPFALVNP